MIYYFNFQIVAILRMADELVMGSWEYRKIKRRNPFYSGLLFDSNAIESELSVFPKRSQSLPFRSAV